MFKKQEKQVTYHYSVITKRPYNEKCGMSNAIRLHSCRFTMSTMIIVDTQYHDISLLLCLPLLFERIKKKRRDIVIL